LTAIAFMSPLSQSSFNSEIKNARPATLNNLPNQLGKTGLEPLGLGVIGGWAGFGIPGALAGVDPGPLYGDNGSPPRIGAPDGPRRGFGGAGLAPGA
jgi:hypothetical protein